MRVKFTDAWQVRVNSSETTLYPRGWSGTVPDEIAEQAIEKGKAESIEPAPEPRKGKSKK